MHQFINLPFGRVGAFPLCAGIGTLVLVLLVLRGASKSGLAPFQVNERLMPALPFCLLFGVLFAGFSDALFHGGIRAACRNPFGRGVNYFGWLLGCLAFLAAFGHMAGLGAASLFEIFVPACLPAQAVGRIGCFLGGCCYGIPVGSKLGVTYPPGSIPFAAYGDAPLFPVQLCEAAWLLAAFAVVMTVVRPGHRAGGSLIAMGVGRFALEFLRGDSRGEFLGIGILSPAQFLSIFLIALGCLLLTRPQWLLRLPGKGGQR